MYYSTKDKLINTISVIVIVFIFLPVALVAGFSFGLFWLMRWPWWVPASALLLALLAAIFTGPGVAVCPGLGYMAYIVAGAGNNFVVKSFASIFSAWKLIISSLILGILAGSILAIWKLRPVIQTAEQKRRKRFFDQSTLNDWLVNWHEKRYLKKEAKKCSKN